MYQISADCRCGRLICEGAQGTYIENSVEEIQLALGMESEMHQMHSVDWVGAILWNTGEPHLMSGGLLVL